MQKEKRDKNKNADKTENSSRKSDNTQNLSGSDSNNSVKEEIPDANKQGKYFCAQFWAKMAFCHQISR